MAEIFAHTKKLPFFCRVLRYERPQRFSFCIKNDDMIDRNTVASLVEQWLADKEYFMVDVMVTADNRVTVEIDHADGVWIEDCVQLSRYIEDHLSRDEQDYELEVGSAGLGQPFKVRQQYVNHIGKEVEVVDADGVKHKGVLTAVEGDMFTIVVRKKVRREGSKRPVLEDVAVAFSFDSVRQTRYLIQF